MNEACLGERVFGAKMCSRERSFLLGLKGLFVGRVDPVHPASN